LKLGGGRRLEKEFGRKGFKWSEICLQFICALKVAKTRSSLKLILKEKSKGSYSVDLSF